MIFPPQRGDIPMLLYVIGWRAMVALLMVGYDLVWLLCPRLRAWMEEPRGRFFRQFQEVVRRPAPSRSAQGGPEAADRIPHARPLPPTHGVALPTGAPDGGR
jgi:hypothetical protein